MFRLVSATLHGLENIECSSEKLKVWSNLIIFKLCISLLSFIDAVDLSKSKVCLMQLGIISLHGMPMHKKIFWNIMSSNVWQHL